MFMISFITFKKCVSCFFLLKIVIDPKTDHDSKTDFPFYVFPFPMNIVLVPFVYFQTYYSFQKAVES